MNQIWVLERDYDGLMIGLYVSRQAMYWHNPKLRPYCIFNDDDGKRTVLLVDDAMDKSDCKNDRALPSYTAFLHNVME